VLILVNHGTGTIKWQHFLRFGCLRLASLRTNRGRAALEASYTAYHSIKTPEAIPTARFLAVWVTNSEK